MRTQTKGLQPTLRTGKLVQTELDCTSNTQRHGGAEWSWLECKSQSKLGTLFNSLGIHLSRSGEEWFWSPLVLNKSTYPAKVVRSCLQCGQWIQCILGTNCNCILIGWEAMAHLGTSSKRRVHNMVVGCFQGITFVITVQAHHITLIWHVEIVEHLPRRSANASLLFLELVVSKNYWYHLPSLISIISKKILESARN